MTIHQLAIQTLFIPILHEALTLFFLLEHHTNECCHCGDVDRQIDGRTIPGLPYDSRKTLPISRLQSPTYQRKCHINWRQRHRQCIIIFMTGIHAFSGSALTGNVDVHRPACIRFRGVR